VVAVVEGHEFHMVIIYVLFGGSRECPTSDGWETDKNGNAVEKERRCGGGERELPPAPAVNERV
jgi:hypothetical protein